MSFLYSLIGFVIVVGVLVFVHEWGHYIVARFFNVYVKRFSIGFGPVIWKRRWGETEWALSAVPLGGYVAFLDEREGEPIPPHLVSRAFNRLPPPKRMAIVAAGPGINLLFAWGLFSLVFWMGQETIRPTVQATGDAAPSIIAAVDGEAVYSWQDVQRLVMDRRLDGRKEVALTLLSWPDGQRHLHRVPLPEKGEAFDLRHWLSAHALQVRWPPTPPIVGSVQPGSPAERGDLLPSDKIVEINGQSVKDWHDLVEKIARLPRPEVELKIRRADRYMTKHISLARKGDRWFLGVGPESAAIPEFFRARASYDLGEAVIAGARMGWQFIEMTFRALYDMAKGHVGVETLAGPIGIAQLSGTALQSGLAGFLGFMGLISLSLGILNLLPIPLLDGGHLLYDTIELITGRPVSETAQAVGQKVGLLFILLLTALALTNDLTRLIHG